MDEARDVPVLHSAKYQQALHHYHGRHIRGRAFNIGDLVLRPVQDNRDCHKLTPSWEVLYIIVEVLRPGTYKLGNTEGEVFPNAWNIEQLHYFYP